ncbi:Protein of unknown function [Sinomicrobium oceani]|uniref:DUF2089 domain-containing protein n=1 Tax=Sinomicrobium oceani TaxID=1150368 RepID=A0A1K1M5X8_9FLAO|nr:DUF2089 family protein [Sinomicrobium oceani]SFW18540.1 Protein of unknown function [Sinomicrobium oceani]
MRYKLPVHCPSCETALQVSGLTCPQCHTVVSGNYDIPLFLRLTPEEQEFIMQFVQSSGSLKEMAAQLGNSYPTVRNRLDDIIDHIQHLQSAGHDHS